MPNFNLPEGMIFADQFRILRLFASGAFGDVYAASDTRSDVNVAIKVVDFSQHPHLEDRFRREAAILAAIRHPHIMRLVSTGDAFDKDGRPVWYMATELISGRTVWNRVQKEGPFSVDEAVDLVGQACDALQHVHDELPETILQLPASCRRMVRPSSKLSEHACSPGTTPATRRRKTTGGISRLRPTRCLGRSSSSRCWSLRLSPWRRS